MVDLKDFIVKQEDAKSSRRLYKMTCDKCSKDRGYQRKSMHGLGLCRACASSITHKGKTVSEETRLRMSSSSWVGNGGKHPLAGKKHSEETKIKLSIATSKQNKNYLAIHTYNSPNGSSTINMKSSWEVKYALYLDSIGQDWVYEPSFKLSNGRIYLPDFQLSTGDIIEIKGYMRPDAQVKWDMFCKDYPSLKKSLLRKSDLKELGILRS